MTKFADLTGCHLVPLTEKHIADSDPKEYCHCAVANAMRDKFPTVHGVTFAFTYFEVGEVDTRLRNSEVLRRWMSEFDNSGTVEPITLIADFDSHNLYVDSNE